MISRKGSAFSSAERALGGLRPSARAAGKEETPWSRFADWYGWLSDPHNEYLDNLVFRNAWRFGVAIGAVIGLILGFVGGGLGGAILFAAIGALLGGVTASIWAALILFLVRSALIWGPIILIVFAIYELWGVGR